MKTVIFQTGNALFKFDKKEVIDQLNSPESRYDSYEVSQLLKLISTDSDEIYLSSDGHHYFGYVVLDLISGGKGSILCKICDKTYDADRLKEITVGHGKSPFDINKERKGGIRLFEKRKMPSPFGGKGYKCPEGHKLISMETWRT